jgi:hypothetical protein
MTCSLHCGAFSGRTQEMLLPAAWLSYLQRERGVTDPVGTLKLPLCPDCSVDARNLRERDDTDSPAFLDAIETGRVIDGG